MKVVLNLDVCVAHGECVVEAPDLFELSEHEDLAILLVDEPPESARERAVRAARVCPVGAITIEG